MTEPRGSRAARAMAADATELPGVADDVVDLVDVPVQGDRCRDGRAAVRDQHGAGALLHSLGDFAWFIPGCLLPSLVLAASAIALRVDSPMTGVASTNRIGPLAPTLPDCSNWATRAGSTPLR